MLNRHPRVAIPLESLFIIDYLRAASTFPLERLKEMLVREPEVEEWGLQVSEGDLENCLTIVDSISKLHDLYAAQLGADVWGQKTPRLVRHLDLLEANFPSARFIHLIRDPRAVVNSLIRSDVHRSDAYHAAVRWLNDVRFGLDFEARRPETTLRVQYEDLVSQPDGTLTSVLQFLDLDPDRIHASVPIPSSDEYSEFYANIHANLSRGPTAAFVDKWRSELSSEDQEVAEAICGSLMGGLGYECELASPRLRRGKIRRLKLKRVFLVALQAIRYLRYRPDYSLHLLWRKWKLGLLWEFLWTVNY